MSFNREITAEEAKNLLENISIYREKEWLTQAELARKIYPDTHKDLIYLSNELRKIKAGKLPKIQFLIKISQGLDCSPETLLAIPSRNSVPMTPIYKRTPTAKEAENFLAHLDLFMQENRMSEKDFVNRVYPEGHSTDLFNNNINKLKSGKLPSLTFLKRTKQAINSSLKKLFETPAPNLLKKYLEEYAKDYVNELTHTVNNMTEKEIQTIYHVLKPKQSNVKAAEMSKHVLQDIIKKIGSKKIIWGVSTFVVGSLKSLPLLAAEIAAEGAKNQFDANALSVNHSRPVYYAANRLGSHLMSFALLLPKAFGGALSTPVIGDNPPFSTIKLPRRILDNFFNAEGYSQSIVKNWEDFLVNAAEPAMEKIPDFSVRKTNQKLDYPSDTFRKFDASARNFPSLTLNYAKAIAAGTLKGLYYGSLGIIRGITNPYDHIIYPVLEFSVDLEILMAANHFDVILPMKIPAYNLIRSLIENKPEIYLCSSERMQSKMNYVKNTANEFKYANGPKRAEMISEPITAFLLPGGIMKVNRALSGILHTQQMIKNPPSFESKCHEKCFFHESAMDITKAIPKVKKKSLSDIRQINGEAKTGKPEQLIWVITEDNQLLIAQRIDYEFGKYGVKRRFNAHIELAGAKPVKAAGDAFVKNGKIVQITNNSGHCKTSGPHLKKYVTEKFVENGFTEARGKFRYVPETIQKKKTSSLMDTIPGAGLLLIKPLVDTEQESEFELLRAQIKQSQMELKTTLETQKQMQAEETRARLFAEKPDHFATGSNCVSISQAKTSLFFNKTFSFAEKSASMQQSLANSQQSFLALQNMEIPSVANIGSKSKEVTGNGGNTTFGRSRTVGTFFPEKNVKNELALCITVFADGSSLPGCIKNRGLLSHHIKK